MQAEEKKQQDLRDAALAIAREDSQLHESKTGFKEEFNVEEVAEDEKKTDQAKTPLLNMEEEELRLQAKLESKTTSKEKPAKKKKKSGGLKSKFKFGFKKNKVKPTMETAETNSKEAPSKNQTAVEKVGADHGEARPDSSLLVFM